MKRIIVIGSLVSCAFLALMGEVQVQSGIEQVLKNIEANNRELQANARLITSQKLEAKTDNNLPDLTLSYAYLWGAKDKNETIGELMVSQSFDFPSLYATRNGLNRLEAGAFDSQADVFRQEKLLFAKEVCLDIIVLRQRKHILEEWLRNAEELVKMYAERLQIEDANALETDKINLELLNIKAETSLSETAPRNKLQELNMLNGNIPVVFEENTYSATLFPADYQILGSEVFSADRTLMAFNNESLVACKQIAANKPQWLPKLGLGYRWNTETETPFNGVVVGLSFPLFENRNKVKIAKVQALNIDLRKDSASLQVESELAQLYREVKTLHTSMEECRKTFQAQQDFALLKQALTGGWISMIEHFVGVSVVYQGHQNYPQLENQYQKAMARIYKSRL